MEAVAAAAAGGRPLLPTAGAQNAGSSAFNVAIPGMQTPGTGMPMAVSQATGVPGLPVARTQVPGLPGMPVAIAQVPGMPVPIAQVPMQC